MLFRSAVRATSKEYARIIAADIAAPGQRPQQPWTPLPELEERGDLYGGHTTHLSTADADGMFVSLTQTLGPNMGSKVVTPGLGFLYASTLGGYLGTMTGPGMRARSNICPFIVAKDGEVLLVLGGAGGGMIPPAVVHAITRVIDFGMELPHALAEPRVAGGSGGALNAETSPGIGWTGTSSRRWRPWGSTSALNPVPVRSAASTASSSIPRQGPSSVRPTRIGRGRRAVRW